MAENESLDLGNAYAQRWNVPFESVRKGEACKDVARKFEHALYSALRRTLKQLQRYGISLSDLLAHRNSQQALQQLIQKSQGHQYVQLFAAAVASSGPSEGECLRSWVDGILDTMCDQIGHRVTGTENWPTFYGVQELMQRVRETLEPAVERIVTNFERDPAWKPKRAASKELAPANPTAEFLNMSLLGAAQR
ncbi:MAG: hypothetical protein L0Z50_01685 [Verrucomicrobiales bacterium]|nr:hypothetical protein [Verrucomicrobiales bacterium]